MPSAPLPSRGIDVAPPPLLLRAGGGGSDGAAHAHSLGLAALVEAHERVTSLGLAALKEAHESVTVRSLFPEDEDIQQFLRDNYSEAQMDLQMPTSVSKVLSARDWLKVAELRWTKGKDIASMPMAEFCHAMALDEPPRALSPAADDDEEDYERGHSPAAEGLEEAEGDEQAPARAQSPAAASVIIVGEGSVRAGSEDESTQPIWPPEGYDVVTNSYSGAMLSCKEAQAHLFGGVGPFDEEMVQQLYHTISFGKTLMPELKHRPTLTKLGMLYMGASNPNDRVKALVCYKHLSVLSRPYVTNKSGAVAHRFCYKEAGTEWPEDCCKMG